jgi:ketosteroid isomerase-like protein
MSEGRMDWKLQPERFAREWAQAWNRGDVEAVLAHFDEEAVFTSPIAKIIGFAEDGVVHGKDALRSYWQAALVANSPLVFEVRAVHRGIDTLVITFTNQGVSRVEVLRFRDGKVIEGHGLTSAG